MIDQAKLIFQLKKAQKDLKNQIIEIEGGEGAVVIEITGEQRIKKIYIDPSRVDLKKIEQLETWLEQAFSKAVSESQKVAAEKMKPYMGLLGKLNLKN